MAIELDATKHDDSGPMGYAGYTNEQLHAAFRLVQNQTHWKFVINCVLVEPTPEQILLINTAIEFFAGGGARFTATQHGNIRVTAPGYYACIGA